MHRLVAAVLLLAPTAFAQNSATAPRLFKDSYAPSANLGPIARTKLFMQTWYHGQSIPLGMVVTQIGWRYDSAAAAASGVTHAMEIVLDNTPVGNAAFTSTFATNLSATPTTFVPLQQINWPAPPSGGLDPAMWIPGAAPFVFVGPHLIVQIDVQTETTPRTLTGYNSDSYLMSGTSPFLAVQGSAGCSPSSASASAVLNGGNVDVTFQLTGGPANSQAVFLIGGENQVFSGLNILPLDLGFLGMTNCKLAVDPLAFLSVPTDGSGNAQLQGSVPRIAGASQLLFAQCAHSGATPLGLVTTNVAGVVVGELGLSNYVYNWTLFGPVAQYGPYTTGRGSIVLLR